MCTRVCQPYLCPIGIFIACQGCLRWQCIWSTVVTGHQPVVCTKGQEETQCRYRPKNPPSQGCSSHPHDSSPNTSFTVPFLLSFQPLGQRLLSPSLVPTAALCPAPVLKKTVCLYQPLPGMLRAGGERNSSNRGGQGGWGEVILRRLSLSNYQWVCCAFIKKTGGPGLVCVCYNVDSNYQRLWLQGISEGGVTLGEPLWKWIRPEMQMTLKPAPELFKRWNLGLRKSFTVAGKRTQMIKPEGELFNPV